MLTRLEIELIVGALLLVSLGVAWRIHNNREQNIGAQACITATTETKGEAVTSNVLDESAQADTLRKVVGIYEKKLSDAGRDNAALVASLHDNALRQRAVSGAAGVGCAAAPDRRLPASEGTAQAERDAALIAVLNACDANQLRSEGLSAAYESARQLALDAQKKPAR